MKQQTNNSILYVVIGVLSVAVLALWLYTLQKTTVPNPTNNGSGSTASALEITVIGDARCSNCQTAGLIQQLKAESYLQNATFVEKDFADAWVADYLQKNGINALPVFIFSSNEINDGGKMKSFLIELPNKSYTLNVGASFDPFAKRSDKGFLLLDLKTLAEIKKDSYTQGKDSAKITWLEYSDLECPYCAQLHNSGTIEEVQKKYWTSINRVFNHFPLPFHTNALPAAQILECLGNVKGSDAFYALAKKSYTEKDSTTSFLIDEAVKLGGKKSDLEKCLKDATFKSKVEAQMKRGTDTFKISGTPGNVLINNETGEYEILNWAVPTKMFTDVIDKLLK